MGRVLTVQQTSDGSAVNMAASLQYLVAMPRNCLMSAPEFVNTS